MKLHLAAWALSAVTAVVAPAPVTGAPGRMPSQPAAPAPPAGLYVEFNGVPGTRPDQHGGTDGVYELAALPGRLLRVSGVPSGGVSFEVALLPYASTTAGGYAAARKALTGTGVVPGAVFLRRRHSRGHDIDIRWDGRDTRGVAVPAGTRLVALFALSDGHTGAAALVR